MSLHVNNTDETENDSGEFWCASETSLSSGDEGTPGAENEECGESIDTNVQALFTSDCAGCHSNPNASKGLELDSGNAWAATYNVSSTQSSGHLMVDPGNSDDSWLVIKLEGTQGSGNGSTMPKSSSSWSTADIQTVRDWIDDGAWK